MLNTSMLTSRWSQQGLGLLRIVTSLLFMSHGSQKLFLFPAAGLTEPFPVLTLLGIAGIIEFVGGLLLLVGVYPRIVAFFVCGEMAVAYFKAHAVQGFWPLVNHGELAVLYCFIFFNFIFSGGGSFSLDSYLRKRKREKNLSV